MPNWCDNYLEIEGPESEMEEFGSACDGSFFLEKFYPIPKELNCDNTPTLPKHELLRKFGATGWYEWCVTNWGTKWDIEDCSMSGDHNLWYVSFTTAWSPPIPGIAEISTLFPELVFTLKYYEPGCTFWGISKIYNGFVKDVCLEPASLNNLNLDLDSYKREVEDELEEGDDDSYYVVLPNKEGVWSFERDTTTGKPEVYWEGRDDHILELLETGHDRILIIGSGWETYLTATYTEGPGSLYRFPFLS